MSRKLFGLLCSFLFLVANRAVGVEPLDWQPDYATAVAQAQKTGKMLLVVQLQSDFTQSPAASREAKIYNVFSLAGDQVPVFLHGHFVAVRQAVGPTEVLKVVPKAGPSPMPQDGAVVAWFCTPRERVVHVVPGYASPAKMLAEAKWAQQLYGKIADLPEPPKGGFPEAKANLVRRQHLQRALPENAAAFKAALGKAADSPDVQTQRVWQAAVTLDNQQLQRRFANVWPQNQQPTLLMKLATHGDIRTDAVHLALSEMPLASYESIHRTVFETLTGQSCWTASPRRAEIAQRFADARRQQQQPLLLVVQLEPADPEQPHWASKHLSVSQQLPAFTVLDVTPAELATLLIDAGLDGITQRENQPVRFLVFDRAGRKAGQISARDNVRRLGPIMEKARAPSTP